MLFDLRGRGRRRSIQGIYLFLALLMGGGLVFFGVGGTGVGLFNSNNNNNGGTGTNPITAQLKAAQRQTRLHPEQAGAWGNLTRQLYLNAQSGDNYDQTNHKFTASGIAELRQADKAFQHYLSLKPAKPQTDVVQLMAAAYGQGGLNQPAKAVTAYETMTEAQPKSAIAFANLAIAAFQASQTDKSSLAEQKAIDLSPKSAKKQMKQYIDGQKTAGLTQQSGQQTSTSLPSG